MATGSSSSRRRSRSTWPLYNVRWSRRAICGGGACGAAFYRTRSQLNFGVRRQIMLFPTSVMRQNPIVFLLPLFVTVSGTPTLSFAQEQNGLAFLAIPSRSAGTCVDGLRVSNTPDLGKGTQTVSLTIAAPNGRRDVTVLVDAKGRTFWFSERYMVMSKPLTGVSDHVLARFDASGTPRGYRSHAVTEMSDSGLKRLDTAEFRVMRERAVQQTWREQLDGSSQQKVKKLAEWVRHRCPLRSNTR
jgi:hypothetical protein